MDLRPFAVGPSLANSQLPMVIFIFCALLLPLLESEKWFSGILTVALQVHRLCLGLIPEDSAYRSLHQSLICGAALPEGSVKTQLQMASLLHLFVVSGAHLVLIETALRKLPARQMRSSLILLSLTVYCFASLLNPPVVRALLNLIFSRLDRFFKTNLSACHQTLLAGVCCALLNPMWAQSLSFLLSWFAAFGIAVSLDFKLKNPIATTFLILALVALPLGSPLPPHPLLVIFNVAMTATFSVFIFPASALIVLPFMVGISDGAMRLFLNLLAHISRELPSSSNHFPSPQKMIFLWALLLSLHALIHLFSVFRRRRSS